MKPPHRIDPLPQGSMNELEVKRRKQQELQAALAKQLAEKRQRIERERETDKRIAVCWHILVLFENTMFLFCNLVIAYPMIYSIYAHHIDLFVGKCALIM